MKKIGLIILLFLAFDSYGQVTIGIKKETSEVKCQIVEKAFIKKNGKATDINELYLRCSIQDYFIKLCESKVSAEELRKYVDKGVSVEIEILEGSWDICDDDPEEMQSRIGTYVAIQKITVPWTTE